MPSPPTLYERIGGRDGLTLLLRRFYADVRQHREIGPIFAAHVEDWPAHLEKIAGFWSGLTGGPALYGGGMAARHIPLRLEEPHFQSWLGLWQRHCRAHLPAAEAEDMIAIAESIGQRLRAITAAHR
jgi:hemoglobin